MRRSLKIVGMFAAIGFVLPWLFLAYFECARYFGHYSDISSVLFALCPSSIMSMALDNASIATSIVVWLMITAENAILYALVGVIVAIPIYLYRKF